MTGVAILPTIVSIMIVLLVLGGTLLVLRWASGWRMKSRRGNTEQRVEMIERHPVGRNGSLVVILHAGTEHVLGVTEESITPIAQVAAPVDLTDDDSTIDLRGASGDRERRRGVSGRLDSLRERTVRR